MDKEQMLQDAKKSTQINAKIKASGTRYVLPLMEREIEVVYYPASQENAPVLFGMHGGGFVSGGCAFDDQMWVKMRDALQMHVISIGYRKTPDHKWPDALYDVLDSIMHILWMPQIAFDRSRIYLFGNSAGGNLAAAATLALKSSGVPIKGQILNYPWLDLRMGSGDEMNDFFAENYLGDADPTNKLVSPIFAQAEDLEDLPPAIVTVCENDRLREEALQYADMLEQAGVRVIRYEAKDMQHAYFESGFSKWAQPEQTEAALETLAFIKEHILKL